MKSKPKIAPREIKPLYFLLGEDEYGKKNYLDEIKRKVFPGEREWMNYEYFLGDEATPAAILDAAGTPGWDLFPPRSPSSLRIKKLVVVDQAEKISPPDWKLMADYFRHPSPDVCLVFLIHCKPNKWTPAKTLPPASVIKLSPLKDRKLLEWLKEEAHNRGLIFSLEALQELLVMVGEDRLALSAELEKLLIFKGGGGKVGPEEVRELRGVGRETSIFALGRFVFSGQTDQALSSLNLLLRAGMTPLQILGFLVSTTRKLWLGREVWEETGNLETVSRAAGVRYFKKEFWEQVRNFKLQCLLDNYRQLLETNERLKTPGVSPRLTMERLVIDLSRSTRSPGDDPGGRKAEGSWRN